jgi:menaquinone-dependent protoporphyrinogen oxidase
MSDRILVTYSTRTGSTKRVSEIVGNTLSQMGEKVDVFPMNEINDLSNYKAVIAGSAIQAGKWLPEAMHFLQKHKHDLLQKPFAPFLVCMTLAMPKGDNYRDTVASWLEPVRSQIPTISEGLFKGTLDIKEIPSFRDRLKFRISVLFRVWKEGDHIDADKIKAWTKNLKSKLHN